jgi:hypothetical protein
MHVLILPFKLVAPRGFVGDDLNAPESSACLVIACLDKMEPLAAVSDVREGRGNKSEGTLNSFTGHGWFHPSYLLLCVFMRLEWHLHLQMQWPQTGPGLPFPVSVIDYSHLGWYYLCRPE